MTDNQDNSPYNFSQEVSDGNLDCPSIAFLNVLYKRFGLEELIEKHLADPRAKEGDYTFDAIIKTVLGNCLFLSGSQNSFHTTARKTEEQEKNVADFIGSENGKIPSPKAIDNVMREIDYEQCNNILMDLFERVRLSKLFFNHPELIPDGYHHFAHDAEVIHTYQPDADHDCENCPYCLKRTREEKTWYHHTVLVTSFIAPGGFKLPIYVHPIRAAAVRDKETASDEEHKQQCELSAFKIVVRKIRQRFPKLKICNLLDSLYANGPCIDLHEELNMAFMIVKKDGSMTTVGEDCDGLMKIEDHKKTNHLVERFHDGKGKKIERTYDFFNEIDYHGKKINVLRFHEERTDRKGDVEITKWVWISSDEITKKNVAHLTMRGRLRWEEEDQFNTAECRGFNMRHDYSRNPHAQMAWVVILNLALALEHIFIYTTTAVKLRKKMSIRDFMKDLFAEIRFYTKEKIKQAVTKLGSIQFRFSPIRKSKIWLKIELTT